MSSETSYTMQYSSYCHSQHKYTNTNMILSIYISFNKAEAKAKGPRPLLPKDQDQALINTIDKIGSA